MSFPRLIQILTAAALLVMTHRGHAQSTAEQPVFSGAGIRAKIVSVAVTKDNQVLTMAAILENTSDKDLVVAMLAEAPQALDTRGNTFVATVNGIATCHLGARITVEQCLDGGKYSLAPDRYTTLEKGTALTVTFVFRRVGDRAHLTQPLGDMMTFSALLTVRLAGGDALGGSRTIGPPRTISIGLPLIPLTRPE